jgi:hypothetical protein
MRSDAVTCSKRCRQARHRFRTGVGVAPAAVSGQPIRLAYADPPYPGLSRRYYEGHDDYAGEVDHAELIRQLSTYDGWALSTNEKSLQYVLGLCPPGVRIGAWFRGERPTRSGGPLNAWEPVIYSGGRRDASRRAGVPRPVPGAVVEDLRDVSRAPGDDVSRGDRRLDVLTYRPGNRLTDPGRVVGTKPAVFARWVFDLLGAEPIDEFVDVFSGSGGVARAWEVFCGREGRMEAGPGGHPPGDGADRAPAAAPADLSLRAADLEPVWGLLENGQGSREQGGGGEMVVNGHNARGEARLLLGYDVVPNLGERLDALGVVVTGHSTPRGTQW